jgi:hypothetical protein
MDNSCLRRNDVAPARAGVVCPCLLRRKRHVQPSLGVSPDRTFIVDGEHRRTRICLLWRVFPVPAAAAWIGADFQRRVLGSLFLQATSKKTKHHRRRLPGGPGSTRSASGAADLTDLRSAWRVSVRESQNTLRRRIQPTIPAPRAPSRIAPGAGITTALNATVPSGNGPAPTAVSGM